MGQKTVRFLPKKNNTDTETVGLVYNKFKIDHKLCQLDKMIINLIEDLEL